MNTVADSAIDTPTIDTTTPKPRRGKNVSQRQLAANRANALKSTGPVTEEGKRIARYNNLQHGLTAVSVCFPFENMGEYEADRAEFYSVIQPANIIERAVVDDLAATVWRRRRTIRNENGSVRAQILQKHDQLRTTFDRLSPDIELSLGVQSLGDESKCLDRIDRHEARLQRNFYTALRMLIQLRRDPPFPAFERPPEIWQDEPIPEIGHPAANISKPQLHNPSKSPFAFSPPLCALCVKSQTEPIPTTGHPPQPQDRVIAARPLPPLTTPSPLTTNHQPPLTTPVKLTGAHHRPLTASSASSPVVS